MHPLIKDPGRIESLNRHAIGCGGKCTRGEKIQGTEKALVIAINKAISDALSFGNRETVYKVKGGQPASISQHRGFPKGEDAFSKYELAGNRHLPTLWTECDPEINLGFQRKRRTSGRKGSKSS